MCAGACARAGGEPCAPRGGGCAPHGARASLGSGRGRAGCRGGEDPLPELRCGLRRPARAAPRLTPRRRRSRARPASSALLLLLALRTPPRPQPPSCRRRCCQPPGRAHQGGLFRRGLRRVSLGLPPFPPSPDFSPSRTCSLRVEDTWQPAIDPLLSPSCGQTAPRFVPKGSPDRYATVSSPFPRRLDRKSVV